MNLRRHVYTVISRGTNSCECCKDIRVLLYSDGQRKRTAETLTTPLCAYSQLLVKYIGGATSLARIRWTIPYSRSSYRHPERVYVKH